MTINQGSKGIRQWPLNRYTSPMMIHKITTFVDLKWWLKCLDTQFNAPANENSIKVLKVDKKTLL